MAGLTTAQRIVGLASSLLAIVESITWFIMSLLCILQYFKNEPPNDISTYGDWVDYYIYVKYLYKDGTVPSGTIVTPTAFSAFMWLYIAIDVFWFINSIVWIFGIHRKVVTLPSIAFCWGLVTLCECSVDLVLAILVGYDYDQVCMKQKSGFETEEICTDAMIPVLVLAVKGFVLWILNLILAYLAIITSLHLTKDASGDRNPFPTGTTKSTKPEKDVIPLPRATIQNDESLYQQQLKNVSTPNPWNVNLRTAYDFRTPPTSPKSPKRPKTPQGPQSPLSINSAQQLFFNR